MKELVRYGTTNKNVYFMLRDSSGNGVTGKVYTDFSVSEFVDGDSGVTLRTPNGIETVISNYTEDSILEIGSGLYQYGAHDELFFSWGRSYLFITCAGYPDVAIEYQIVAFDTEDETRMGMLAIPDVVSGGSGAIVLNTDIDSSENIATAVRDITVSEPTNLSDKTMGGLLYHAFSRFFHKVTQTSSSQIVYKDDGTTALGTMAVSDDGTTQTKGEASEN